MVYHPTYTKQFRKTGNVSTVVTINRLCIRIGANNYSSKSNASMREKEWVISE